MISLQEQITNTAMGKLLQRLIISYAEFEREQTSERTKAGYVGMFQKGMYAFGGELPLGISKTKDKKLYFNKDINKVKFIFKKLEQGYTYSSISRLFEKKYNMKLGKNYIEQLSKKDLYKGYVEYFGVKYYLIEPINKLQKIKREVKNKPRVDTTKYIFNKYLDNCYCQSKYKFNKTLNKVIEYKYYEEKGTRATYNEEKLNKIINKKIKITNKEKSKIIKKRTKRINNLYISGLIKRDKLEYHLGHLEKDTLKNFAIKDIKTYDYNVKVILKKGDVIAFNYKEEVKQLV